VLELVGVDHGADRLHLAVGDVEREDAGHPASSVVGHRSRLAVDQGRHGVRALLVRPAEEPEQEPGDPFRPVRGLARGPALTAAVADHDHVGGQEVQQAIDVAAVDRVQEPAGDLVALLA
jgi:hypothetical protein